MSIKPNRAVTVIITAQLVFICYLQYKFLILETLKRELQDAVVKHNTEIVKYFPNMPHSVDVVITWVNGSDEKFLKQLHTYRNDTDIQDDVNSDRRFNNKNELKYALRSVEKNMPWIRHVYIVTNGQVPNWLDLENGYATVIPHEAIFLNKSTLPTFSSPAIEANLHRIPGLSKYFLYFNDDWLVAKPVEYSTFYTVTEGLIYYWMYPIEACALLCPWSFVHNGFCNDQCNVPDCQYDGGDCQNSNSSLPFYLLTLFHKYSSPYHMSFQTTNRLFNRKFGYLQRYIMPHMPILVDKDIMTDAWLEFQDELLNTSSHRFRDHWDMQYSFFYTHYVREKKRAISLTAALAKFDKNNDGRIEYKELLTMRAKHGNYSEFDRYMKRCVAGYIDKVDAAIKDLAKCNQLQDILKDTLMLETKYKHTFRSVPKEHFYEMVFLFSYIDMVVIKLEDLRKSPPTFVCLNDELEHIGKFKKVNQIIVQELVLFYEGMFPVPSKYELPVGQSNNFGYIEERGISSPAGKIAGKKLLDEPKTVNYKKIVLSTSADALGWMELAAVGMLFSMPFIICAFYSKWRVRAASNWRDFNLKQTKKQIVA